MFHDRKKENMVEVVVEHYPPIVGMSSCVAFLCCDYPMTRGNYCSIEDGPYLVNLWAENLQEWARRNPDAGKIEVTVISDEGNRIGLVTDSRLREWCHSRLRVTGHDWPSEAAKQKTYELLKEIQ